VQVEIQAEPKFSKIEHLFVLLAEGAGADELNLPGDLKKTVAAAVKEGGFGGRSDESFTILHGAPAKITIIGLGKREAISLRGAKAAVYAIAKTARRNRNKTIAVAFPYALPGLDERRSLRHLADILSVSDYRYDRFITVKQNDRRYAIHAYLVAPAGIDSRMARRITDDAAAIAAGVETVRDLGNAPPNELTPVRLAERAKKIADDTGLKCTVYDKRAIEKMKMGGLLAVNQGTVEEPRFIVLEHAPKKATKTVCLVGKGITFDSGGISIKPAEKMDEMKFDMCGAGAVVGTLQAVALLDLPVHVYGIIPATENLPSGSAYKPGDIITMMSGKTVEVLNTDAEGRMILADALHYASKLKPDHIIDYATLTGACIVALAAEATGLFVNDDELARKLIEAGEKAGERLWRLPLWDEYTEYIKSDWADMKNTGGRWGGAITAAVFLKEFVDCPSWAHLDIAGTAWTEGETPRDPKGATGVGVRATIAFLEALAG
jgi:leucyl aminopeptidase